MMIGHRGYKKIFGAFFKRQHYIAFYNMFHVYGDVLDALNRYIFARGAYPAKICVRTPVGKLYAKLYTYHDMLTLNEVFCRGDYGRDLDSGVVVDIGSNIGISALYFLSRNSYGRCYLYEPDPKNVDRLHNQLEEYKDRYSLQEFAVGDKSGCVKFGVEPTGRYGGIDIETGENINVDCVEINDALKDVLAIESRIDLLKIDIEGLEEKTVRAIDPGIRKKIGIIYIESTPDLDLFPGEFLQKQYGSVCRLININYDPNRT